LRKNEDDPNSTPTGTSYRYPPQLLPDDINVMKHRWAAKADSGLSAAGSAGKGLLRLGVELVVILGLIGLVYFGLKQLF
jgi:hypothetical protein